jgi:hypothetical protein
LLLAVLERAAAAGRLKVSPETAAQMVMAANAGVALSLLSRPAIYIDPELSTRVRDAVVATVVTETPSGDGSTAQIPSTAVAAATLGAQLRHLPPTVLSAAETALLQQWLTRLADTSPAA